MKPFDWKIAVLDVLAIDEGANQVLLKHIHPRAWRAELPEGSGKKTIASTFAHIHNCRLMWMKITGKRTGLPPSLNRNRCTKKEASRGLKRSADALSRHIEEALEHPDGRIKGFPLSAIAFLSYLVTHDAHHRGQILLLARQLGHRLPEAARHGVWHWSKIHKSLRPRQRRV